MFAVYVAVTGTEPEVEKSAVAATGCSTAHGRLPKNDCWISRPSTALLADSVKVTFAPPRTLTK